MSALADEVREAVRQVLREEWPRMLAELRGEAGPAQAPGLLSVQAAARRLGLAVGTIYKMAEKCELPSTKIGGRLLFSAADLNTYAEARRRSPERVQELAKAATEPGHA